MKRRDRVVVEFAIHSPIVKDVWYAGGLRAVPTNTKKSREVLPLLNPLQNQAGVIL